ncbi:MAG: ATP-binding cassette domain-containing protein [Oscillospiraceae bacterium]
MINIENLNKEYKKNEIFSNVTVSFPKDKINFILGKNGTGKTTLFKCILNLENFNGTINMGYTENLKIFCIYDDTPFYKNLTGLQNIDLFQDTYKTKNKIEQNLLPNETLNKKVSSYSYGQKKKLAIIIAELINPDILLLDEVSNGLDYETIMYLKKNLKKFKENKTILMTGHQLDFYEELVENLYLIKDKNIIHTEIENETLGEIYEKHII